jgi:formate dehydrogenase maturation protein FdhE
MPGEKITCDVGKLCPWMGTALARSKTFRWETVFVGESTAVAAETSMLFVKLPHQRMHEVIACPVCGGRPRPALPPLKKEPHDGR